MSTEAALQALIESMRLSIEHTTKRVEQLEEMLHNQDRMIADLKRALDMFSEENERLRKRLGIKKNKKG